MLIKHKLIANFTVLVVNMIAMLLILSFSSSSLQIDIELTKNIGKVESEILLLRRHEKDFLARRDIKYLDKFNKVVNSVHQNINKLQSNYDDIGIEVVELTSLVSILNKYKQEFQRVVEAQKNIGFNPKDGLYGQLRNAAHNVEELIGDQDFEILSLRDPHEIRSSPVVQRTMNLVH
ncbi:MAG: hypothetical protein HRT38_02165 [Alteromonadaceae bacterium]|nr:hypothetical protein [Alteromonadaceae bacterium]